MECLCFTFTFIRGNKIGYIYKIVNNINNKVYVGKTSRTIEIRWQEHRKNFYKLQDNMVIHKAMFKYGPEAFNIKEIESCDDEIIDEREKYWIEYYNSYKNGYNSTLGGEGAIQVNYKDVLVLWEERLTLQQISEKIEVDRHTISKILKIYNVSEKEIFRRGIGRPIIQYDLKGNFLNRYDSITDAANSLKKENISAIRNCCMRRIKSAYNFLWKFEDDDTTIEELVYDFNLSGKGQYKKVEQYDLNGKFISEFDSCREAARSINAPYHVGISSCCIGKQKTAYGYKWKYKDN